MDNLSLIHLFNIKLSTLIAGLFGAFFASLKTPEGTLKGKIGGYFMACVTILYVVPFFCYLLVNYGYEPHFTTENLLSFIFGTVANRVSNNLIDDPIGSAKRLLANITLFKKLFSLVDNAENKEKKNDEHAD